MQPARSSQDSPHDVGTLWMMQRRDRYARCALMTWATAWELRVLVDGDILLTERCKTASDAFEVAERWKGRMIDRGWRQIKPGSAGRAAPGAGPNYVR